MIDDYASPGTRELLDGMKYDQNKLDYTLIPFWALHDVVRVLEHGVKKYRRDNWQRVERPRRRYLAAAFRHLSAVSDGEWLDQDSGLPHVAHAACNCLFLIWFGDGKDE